MITKKRGLEILHKNIGNENLRKHHYAVAAAMRSLAEYFKNNPSVRHSELDSESDNSTVSKDSDFRRNDRETSFGEPAFPAGSSPEESFEEFDADKWELVGLLHDADYEETKENPQRHAAVIAEQLESEDVDEDIIYAIKAHNYEHLGVQPESKMDWSLVACDDLTGLIVAVALVHPDKLANVTTESVMKKFSTPSFAAGVDRERIKMCKEKLGIDLEEFVGIVLTAMKNKREELGL